MQPLVSRFRDHVPPSVAHVSEAAEVLCIREHELFRFAHQWWCDEPCEEARLDRVFGEYLVHETVPPWVRHYCRCVLAQESVGQLHPEEFGVERASARPLSLSEQRWASLITLLAFVAYWLLRA